MIHLLQGAFKRVLRNIVNFFQIHGQLLIQSNILKVRLMKAILIFFSNLLEIPLETFPALIYFFGLDPKTSSLHLERHPPWIKMSEKKPNPHSSWSLPKQVVSPYRIEYQGIQKASRQPL